MALSISKVIELRGPQYVADPRLADLITLAKQRISQTVYGDNYNEAVALLVLHRLTLEALAMGNPGTGTSGGTQTGGQVASMSEGDLSISYKQSSTSATSLSARNDDMSSTQFGREFLGLMKGTIVPFRNNTI